MNSIRISEHNATSIQIHPENEFEISIDKPFIGRIILPSSTYFSQDETDVIDFQIRFMTPSAMKINFNDHELTITLENIEKWVEFFNRNFNDFIGLMTIFSTVEKAEDILWVDDTRHDMVNILGIRQNDHHWKGTFAVRNKIELYADYFLSGVLDRREWAKELLEQFQKWLGSDFPFDNPDNRSERKPLTIKVHPNSTWFLLFPISHFCQFDYGAFKFYNDPEWIVTQKLFIQNTYERLQIEAELSDIQQLLQHSVFIVNTYNCWGAEKEKIEIAVSLIREIFRLLQDIDLQNGVRRSLKWYLNPKVSEVYEKLLNPETWYFFADFHVEQGTWQPGDGKYQSWLSDQAIDTETNLTNSEENTFNLHRNWDLSHVRLMRVFHCKSAFESKGINEAGRQPVDASSIVRLLLNAGVRRVEGAMTVESCYDYLCSLCDLLCRHQGLGPLLMGKCLENGKDYHDLMNRINQFLNQQEWEAIE